MKFDIFFSPETGFIIDFPFLHFSVDTIALLVTFGAIAVLRARKLIRDRRRRVAVETQSLTQWEDDLFDAGRTDPWSM